MNEAAESLLALPNTDLLDLECSLLTNNDYGNGLRFEKRHGQDIMYVEAIGWYIYTDGYWRHKGAETRVSILASEICTHIMEEYNALGTPIGFDYYLEEMGEGGLAGFRDELIKWAKRSGNRPQINGLAKVAMAKLTIESTELDRGKDRLNLKNGTMKLDRYCIDLQPHNREDYITKRLNVTYDDKAKCPKFDAFLERVIPDEAVREFLQCYMGYCLTGDVSEQKFVFLFGTGANGKSVFVDLMAQILGPYAVSLPFESLIKDDRRRGSEATPDLARLPGARFVRASEPEQGSRFAEATIKQITGGEEMTVRHLNRDFFTFYPEFKLMLSGNHKPYIKGADEGIWRRIALVKFGEYIPRNEQNPNLLGDLLEEKSGVLNWMLGGCQKWHADKLIIPDAVVKETAEYRDESDPMSSFIRNQLMFQPGTYARSSELHKKFNEWMEASGNGGRPWSIKAFSGALGERKIKYNDVDYYFRDLKCKRDGGLIHFKDVALIPEEDD